LSAGTTLRSSPPVPSSSPFHTKPDFGTPSRVSKWVRVVLALPSTSLRLALIHDWPAGQLLLIHRRGTSFSSPAVPTSHWSRFVDTPTTPEYLHRTKFYFQNIFSLAALAQMCTHLLGAVFKVGRFSSTATSSFLLFFTSSLQLIQPTMPFTSSGPVNNGSAVNGPGAPVAPKGAGRSATQPRPLQVTGSANVHRDAPAPVEATQNKGETPHGYVTLLTVCFQRMRVMYDAPNVSRKEILAWSGCNLFLTWYPKPPPKNAEARQSKLSLILLSQIPWLRLKERRRDAGVITRCVALSAFRMMV
jgi:hypothetical protein